MKRHQKLAKIVFSCVFVTVIVAVIACSGTSSNTNLNTNSSINANTNLNTNADLNANTNLNTNANSATATKAIDLSTAEPRVVSICKTLSDKIALFCKDSRNLISEWQEKAISDADSFIPECVANEIFENTDKKKLDAIETDVNNASNCSEIAAAF